MTACYTHVSPTGGASGLSQVAVHLHGNGALGWKNLKILDVAGNRLSVFPVGFQFLTLEELFFEGNSLVQFTLMESIQEKEVLSLKELSARLILQESTNRFSVVSRALPTYPELQDMLSQWGQCVLCSQPFLTTWLECVHFINTKKADHRSILEREGASEMKHALFQRADVGVLEQQDRLGPCLVSACVCVCGCVYYEAEQDRVLWELNEAAGAIAQHTPHEQRDFYYDTIASAASALVHDNVVMWFLRQ
ncbi:Leucine-rich repeat-containing protein 69 [Anabarilius grahami]|uniref:Leucine-rich repeat-containing protein 69 n=1 Tax=Anabarilius grahami TaxID=495550 RepID=A0A3N0XZE8_ANAGA|nr:Leucine-rich repeat-containing protein 69 [Anabarilius grahami]